MEPTIYLNNGTYFNFLKPEASQFSIYDIANALSKICRFTGQGEKFYSVAEHSVHVSYLVPEEDALEALMHDSPEFVVGDVSTPLKNLIPDYKIIETNVEIEIFKRFGLRYPFPPSVKYADKQMFYVEKEQVMCNYSTMRYLDGINKPDVRLKFYNHLEARTVFLDRFFKLKKIRGL